MKIYLLLTFTLFSSSIATGQDYFRTTEVSVLAGPIDEFDEGEAPAQFGGSFTYHFSPRIGTEFYYSRGSLDQTFQYPADPETGDPGYISRSKKTVQILSGRMLIHFAKNRFKPYVAFGGASVKLHIKGRDRNFGQGADEIFFDETDNRVGIDCNMGIKYHLTPAFSIRSEVGSILMEGSLLKLTFLFSYQF